LVNANNKQYSKITLLYYSNPREGDSHADTIKERANIEDKLYNQEHRIGHFPLSSNNVQKM